jgi:DNA-binding beta-propeller fold protein YncE
VDPKTNQAFVLEAGSGPQQAGQIEIINLGPAASNTLKSTQITELVVPSPTPGPGVIGGVPNALVPQATLTSTQPLVGVQIFGSGFAAGAQVRLDSVDIATKGGTINNISANGNEMDVTIPASFLSAPHHYSVDVISNGVPSNSTEFIVIQAVDMSNLCFDSSMKPLNTVPTSVVIADQLANGPFSPIAVVSNSGCNSISMIDINPANATFGHLIGSPITVGTTPQGVAISQRYGLAVVANNGSSTASVIDLTAKPPAQKVPDVSTGTNSTGVAINDATGAAIVANTGSNTVTMLNLGSLFPAAGTTPPTTLTPTSIGGIQEPIAVAIDPDRGTNNQGIAVVTSLQLQTGAAPQGALAVVEIGLSTPTLSTVIPSGSVTATPTGIVFDPTVVTGTANNGVFYANSSGSNVVTAFNPDTGSGSSVNVGINPTSLALNPQTGAILTSNSASNTISVVDTLSSPFKTIKTLGLPGSGTFGVAIDQFTNLAVIVDQANNRILLFPMPN